MRYPNLKEEKKLWRKRFKRVAGLDEAGRGALCGPVVAAAVVIKNSKFETRNSKQILNSKFQFPKRFRIWDLKNWNLFRISPQPFNKGWATQPIENGLWSDLGFGILLKEVKDSKKLSPKKREELYKIITHSDLIEWGIGKVSEKVIDKINILEATKLAMKKALKNLTKKQKNKKTKKQKSLKRTIVRIKKQNWYLILDGNFKIDSKIPQKSIVKGDNKVFSIAAASILAKVYRDKIMERYDKKYPRYGFSKHKGYPTKHHFKMLKKYGPCKIHRKSFGPVRKCYCQ